MRLVLSLKKQWFDLIKSGVKKEEYRELSLYWSKRLLWSLKYPLCFRSPDGFLIFDELEFTLGYPCFDDLARRLVFKNPTIRVDFGSPLWGALPDKEYFVISWDSPNN